MFDIYVSLTNMYWLVCVMDSHKMKKVNKIIFNLSAEDLKILILKLQKDESS